MQKKGLGKGLGKGIDSLIIDKSETKEEIVSRETLINTSLIEPNKKQPRRHFDEDSLQELADSIKMHGIIQPLIVQKKDLIYEIIAGERRWRAARIAGLKKVPVIIKDFTEQEIFEIALIENIQREDLNPIEEASAYARLIEEHNLKQDEVAERVGKSRVAVTNSMRLLRLDSRIQQMLIDEMLTEGHARTLLAIKDSEMQYKFANRIFDEKLSVRETEHLVKKEIRDHVQDTSGKDIKSLNQKDVLYQDIENKIAELLGSKVSIKRRANDKGKIEIEYYTMEELERILEFMNRISSLE